MTPQRVVVIGGGITGLACALRLQDYVDDFGRSVDITLLEAASGLGGKLRTDRVSGFVIDTAADIFLASRPAGMRLCRRLGIEDQLIETDPSNRRTFVHTGSGLEEMPFYRNERLVTFPTGIQTLTDAAIAALHGVHVLLGTTAAAVVNVGGSYEVHAHHGVLRADAVVMALPARPASSVVRPLSREAAAELSSVMYRTSITVSAAYERSAVSHPLDGYGYLVPGARRGDLSACTWSSSKIPGRAPEGYVLVRGFVHGGPDVTLTHARDLVLRELASTLDITDAPVLVRVHTWRDGIPVTGTGSSKRSQRIREALSMHPGCVIAGGAVDGAGVPHSIQSGQSAAEYVWRYLNTRSRRAL